MQEQQQGTKQEGIQKRSKKVRKKYAGKQQETIQQTTQEKYKGTLMKVCKGAPIMPTLKRA